jgi:tetratricopeptide (TPR) repeat protein
MNLEVAMKKLYINLLLIFLLVLALVTSTSCTKKSDDDIYAKAEALLNNGDYDDAIKEFKKILESNEYDLIARDYIAEAYIKKEAYADADQWLEAYFNFVNDNLDNNNLKLAKAIDSLGDYGRDLLREGETVGAWYQEVKPSKINLDSIETSYIVGDTLNLTIPNNLMVFYTLDYSSPKLNGIPYTDGILFDTAGYFELSVITQSKFGEYSFITTAYIDVSSNDFTDTTESNDDSTTVEPVLIDTADGAYNEPLSIRITNYDSTNERYSILYTLNGQDPRSYSSPRYYYDYLDLFVGQYDFTFAVYDNDSGEFSDLSYASIYINNPNSLKIGFYGLPDRAIEEYRSLFEQAYWEGYYPELVLIDDLNNLNLTELPDALITYDYYAEDLANLNVLADIDFYFDLNQYEFLANAPNAGRFNGINYLLPLTIRPEYMVYGDYSNAGNVTWKSLAEPSSWYENKFMYAADRPEYLLGIYYGLGGTPIDTESGNITLDKSILTEALRIISSMPSEGIGTSLYSSEDVNNALINYTVESVLMDDRLSRDPDYAYSYVGIGGMPLPNGKTARFYNVVTGLLVSSYDLDATKVAEIQTFYDYVLNAEYNFPYVAQTEGSLPAIKSLAINAPVYYSIDSASYIDLIENGITQLRSYALYNLYEAMNQPLAELLSGATPEDVATQIMNALGL